MKALSGWRRKLVLIALSEKRLDAPVIMKTFTDKSLDEMKTTIITEAMCDTIALTNKPRTNDLQAHLDNLKHQFIGRSELCFYHATLVVLLRRAYKIEDTFAEFEQLWSLEIDYLLQHLSLRWLISACDTFVDHSKDTTRAAILMNVTTLMNTLRVYETKQFLQTDSESPSSPLNEEKIEVLYQSDLPLYEGLTYFRIGTDDTLKNMRSRYEKFGSSDKLAATMLLSIFDKLQINDSAFATMRLLHKNERSQWWLA